MFHILRTFGRDDGGAVTVDWVVLTAAVVGLAIGAFTLIETSSGTLMGETTAALGTQDAASSF